MALWVPAKPEIFTALDLSDMADSTIYSMLTVDQITREAIRLFKNSNAFIQSLESGAIFYKGMEWDASFS